MPELTADVVRDIVETVVDTKVPALVEKAINTKVPTLVEVVVDKVVDKRLQAVVEVLDTKVRDIVRQEIQAQNLATKDDVTSAVSDGMQQVIDVMESLHETQMDEIVGLNGRLASHNHRIAVVERHLKLRPHIEAHSLLKQ